MCMSFHVQFQPEQISISCESHHAYGICIVRTLSWSVVKVASRKRPRAQMANGYLHPAMVQSEHGQVRQASLEQGFNQLPGLQAAECEGTPHGNGRPLSNEARRPRHRGGLGGLQIPSSNSVRFRPWRGRIRFDFEGVGTGFGSVPTSRNRIRFGFGAREPDSVRFLRLETGFGSVWPDRISGWRLGPGFRLVLGGYWFISSRPR